MSPSAGYARSLVHIGNTRRRRARFFIYGGQPTTTQVYPSAYKVPSKHFPVEVRLGIEKCKNKSISDKKIEINLECFEKVIL